MALVTYGFAKCHCLQLIMQLELVVGTSTIQHSRMRLLWACELDPQLAASRLQHKKESSCRP